MSFSVLKLSDVPRNTRFGQIKDYLRTINEFGYVHMEDSDAFIKFNSKDKAEKIMRIINNKCGGADGPYIELNGKNVSVSVPDEQETDDIIDRMEGDSRGDKRFSNMDRGNKKGGKFKSDDVHMDSNFSVLKLSDLPKNTRFGQIKDYLRTINEFGYVHIEDSNGYIKLYEDQAERVMNAINEECDDEPSIKINGKTVQVFVLEGDEKDEILEKMQMNKGDDSFRNRGNDDEDVDMEEDCSMLKLSDLPDNTNFGLIKDYLKTINEFGYVHIENSNGYIKFNDKDKAERILKLIGENCEDDESPFIELNGENVVVSIVDGDEKFEILKKTKRDGDRRRNNPRPFRGGGGRNFRYGGPKRNGNNQGGYNNKRQRQY